MMTSVQRKLPPTKGRRTQQPQTTCIAIASQQNQTPPTVPYRGFGTTSGATSKPTAANVITVLLHIPGDSNFAPVRDMRVLQSRVSSCVFFFIFFMFISKCSPSSAFGSRSLVTSARRRNFATSACAATRRISRAFSIPARQLWAAAGLVCFTAANAHARSHSNLALSYCQGFEDDETDEVAVQPFHEDVLEYDHYNGVIMHLDKLSATYDPSQFGRDLTTALTMWKAEGRKGIWVHCPSDRASLIPFCTMQGFDFHFVKHRKNEGKEQDERTLILSQWLSHGASRLPLGPTHQIGVGVVVLNPKDPSLMLCVQEKTGPAAAYGLWKMPTGLLDPHEDIPDAAKRELMEETGLRADLEGILCFRQAHSPSRSSDLFFVCHMALVPTDQTWTMQEEEIADIRWMSVEEYCNQERWQGSPVYEKLNDSIRQVSKLAQEQGGGGSKEKLIAHERLALGFGTTQTTNALFRSQL